MRGFAALAVVFGHTLHVLPEFGDRPYLGPPTWFGTMLRFSPLNALVDGHAAVLVFFALSGLVLALPYLRGRALAYPVWLAKRAARLYPPYVAALVLAAILQLLLRPDLPAGWSAWLRTTNWTDRLTPSVAADYALMLGRHLSLDNPVWSLHYEMRLSAIFPLLVIPAVRFRTRGGIITAACCLAMAFVLLHGDHPGLMAVAGNMALYGALFAAGATLARHIDAFRGLRSRWPSLVLAGAAWLLIWLCWSDYPLSLAALLLIAAALSPGPLRDVCHHPAARFLGRISFSLYLVHVPLLLALLALLHGTLPVHAILLMLPPTAILAAWLFHRCIEAPSHRLARAIGQPKLKAGPQGNR